MRGVAGFRALRFVPIGRLYPQTVGAGHAPRSSNRFIDEVPDAARRRESNIRGNLKIEPEIGLPER